MSATQEGNDMKLRWKKVQLYRISSERQKTINENSLYGEFSNTPEKQNYMTSSIDSTTLNNQSIQTIVKEHR
ncbi:851_t:CDS:2 [Gigaspora rosea]|nr:851_t:CDS:2 [Gigaspora rosea]